MTDKPDIAALISSRICHDLISPIGAIGNGVELLMMEAGVQTPELALISDSVHNANARIRFFRVAFGAAPNGAHVARSEVTSILSDIARGGRLTYDWQSTGDLTRREVKLVFLLLMCLESAMAYGGHITIRHADTAWQISAEADRLRIDPALWEVLTERHPPAEIGPGQVHFALVPETLHSTGRRLITELKETRIHFTF